MLPHYFTIAIRHVLRHAYRIEPGFDLFFSGSAFVLMIALMTVSDHAVKAALANPVDALRYE